MLHMSAVFVSDTPARRYRRIAALQYSHVKYFPNQDVYTKYYYFVVDICDIGVESFATRAHTMLVDHLREHYGQDTFVPVPPSKMSYTNWQSHAHSAREGGQPT